MHKIKKVKILITLIAIFSFFGFTVPVFATTGNGTLEFEGSSTVSVGQNFIIRLYVSDINNTSGIVAMEGNLNFDNMNFLSIRIITIK